MDTVSIPFRDKEIECASREKIEAIQLKLFADR